MFAKQNIAKSIREYRERERICETVQVFLVRACAHTHTCYLNIHVEVFTTKCGHLSFDIITLTVTFVNSAKLNRPHILAVNLRIYINIKM